MTALHAATRRDHDINDPIFQVDHLSLPYSGRRGETPASGFAERAAARTMVARIRGTRRVTVGADKAYDTAEFVEGLRRLQVMPHVAQNTSNRSSAIDERTTRHAGYLVSQQKRKRGDLWLAEDRGPAAEDPASRHGPRRLDLGLRPRGVQPWCASEI